MMLHEYLAFAKPIALEAGNIMQSERREPLHVQRKPDGTRVTRVDRHIQDYVIDAILRAYPGHSVIGEERSYGRRDAEHIWIVDPLDGTGEYIDSEDEDGLSYGFGLAKQYRGEIEAGLFFNPSRNELYTAAAGLGSYLNGVRIRVNQNKFTPGIPYDVTGWQSRLGDARVFEKILGRPPLNYYSAIYKGCAVARGASTFNVFLGDTLHDIAPAAILVQEAGGRVTDVHGRPHDLRSNLAGAIYSNGVTHEQVVKIFNQHNQK